MILLLHLPYLAFNLNCIILFIHLDSAYFHTPQKKRYETEIEIVYLRRSIIRPLLKIENNTDTLYTETRESVILKSSGKGLPCGSVVKNLPCNVRDMGLIPD